MDYINVSSTVLNPIYSHIKRNWVNSDHANFYEKEFFARGAFLGFAPLSVVTHVIDTVIGVGSGTGAILTGGTHKATNVFAINHLNSSKWLLSSSYASLLSAINPKASFGSTKNGFVADFVIDSLKNMAKDCSKSDNPFTRHVTSRLSYALLAISALVARAVDGVIGAIAALFSFITVGKFETLNDLALEGLQAPGIINDLFCCAIKTINPWAEGVKFDS